MALKTLGGTWGERAKHFVTGVSASLRAALAGSGILKIILALRLVTARVVWESARLRKRVKQSEKQTGRPWRETL